MEICVRKVFDDVFRVICNFGLEISLKCSGNRILL